MRTIRILTGAALTFFLAGCMLFATACAGKDFTGPEQPIVNYDTALPHTAAAGGVFSDGHTTITLHGQGATWSLSHAQQGYYRVLMHGASTFTDTIVFYVGVPSDPGSGARLLWRGTYDRTSLHLVNMSTNTALTLTKR